MIQSYQLARVLRAELRSGAIETVWPDFRASFPHFRVTGRIDTEVLIVPVEIHVWRDFELLKRLPPRVWCRESWTRQGPEWHNSDDGLCWVLRDEWCDGMSWEGKKALDVIRDGRRWLLNGVRNLINRHYTAHLEELKCWDDKWDYWGHFGKGSKEYEREKRLRRAGADSQI